jgi:hypothetical protein
MITTIRATIAVLALALFVPPAAQAQKKPHYSKSDESATRGLFVSKRADAMRIIILAIDGSVAVPVDPSREFKEGDQIKVSFESNFDGYVYIVNVTPGGKRMILFPDEERPDNFLRANQQYQLPGSNAVIQFDAEKGVEVLQFIMSRERVAFLDEAIKDSAGNLGESAASAAAELSAGLAEGKVAAVAPDDKTPNVRSRGIKFAQGKDKNPEGSVIAISDKGGAGGQLKPGEAATFEIRLKHN